MGRLKSKWSWLVHLALSILVIVSLALTFSIFNPPLEVVNWFQRNTVWTELTTPNTATNTQTASSSLTSVFAAQAINFHLPDGTYYQTRSEDILAEAQQLILSPAQADIDWAVKKVDEGTFRNQIALDQFIEVEYSDLVPARFLVDSIMNLPEERHNMMFNSLIYVQDSDYIAFVNEVQGEVYQVSMEKLDGAFLWDLFSENEDLFLEVEPYTLVEGRNYLSVKPVTAGKLTYMIEQQPNTNYLNLLFSSPREIQDFSDANFSRYFSGEQSLVINNKTYELEFNQEVNSDSEMDTIEMMDASFQELQRYQLVDLDGWYYVNFEDNMITYRKFINGLPIFGQNFVSKMQFSMAANQVTTLRMSTVTAQTPLVDRTKQYRLMSGRDAIRLLQTSQTPISEVQNLRLGYSWLPSTESARLIELVPAWYVKVADHWYLLERLVDIYSYPELATVDETTGEKIYMVELFDNGAEQLDSADSDSMEAQSAEEAAANAEPEKNLTENSVSNTSAGSVESSDDTQDLRPAEGGA